MRSFLITLFLFSVTLLRIFLVIGIIYGMFIALILNEYARGTAIMASSYIVLDLLYKGDTE